MVRHSLQTSLSVGYYRNTYTPPDSPTSCFTQDYAHDGRLLQSLYLGTGRHVIYKYSRVARLAEILYDSTLVTFTYDEATGAVKTIHLMHEGFVCTIRYRQTGKSSTSTLWFDRYVLTDRGAERCEQNHISQYEKFYIMVYIFWTNLLLRKKLNKWFHNKLFLLLFLCLYIYLFCESNKHHCSPTLLWVNSF